MNRAIALARQTKCLFRVQICAIIAKKRRIIAIGYPQAKSSPLQCQYSKNPMAVYIHAEIDAIAKATRYKSDLSDCDIYIARVDKQGDIKPIHPCPGCTKAIAAFNLKRIYHT
jgi:deoxycytidylate deaminase